MFFGLEALLKEDTFRDRFLFDFASAKPHQNSEIRILDASGSSLGSSMMRLGPFMGRLEQSRDILSAS